MYLGYRPICDGTCGSIEALQGRFINMPLLGYAAKHWGDHARQVEQELSSEILQVVKDEGIRGVLSSSTILRSQKSKACGGAF